MVGVVLTAAVSPVFAAFGRRDVLLQPLCDRLRLVEEVLKSRAVGESASGEVRRYADEDLCRRDSASALSSCIFARQCSGGESLL